MSVQISRVDAQQATQLLPDLVEILRDAVDSGASIGFLPPLAAQEAETYWREVIESLKKTLSHFVDRAGE